MKRDVRLDAVDFSDFGPVVAGDLITGARAYLEDGAGGRSDESRNSLFDVPFS